jgi:hypothetical protein
MRTITLGRLLLSNSFVLNCQIASLLAVTLLLSDIVDASNLPSQTGTYEYSLQFEYALR